MPHLFAGVCADGFLLVIRAVPGCTGLPRFMLALDVAMGMDLWGRDAALLPQMPNARNGFFIKGEYA